MTLVDTGIAEHPDVSASVRAADARAHRVRTIAVWTVSAVVLSLVAIAFLFHSSGGRWFIVQTPSMGTFAPVGTLVLTTPTPIEDIHVGDVVTFHPSTTPDETYTHRVVGIRDGLLETQGDINGALDPWQTGQDQLIGKVTTAIPGAGWLAKALPLLLAGSAVVWLLTRFLSSPTQRTAMRMLGLSLVASLTVFLLRPFVGIIVLEATMENGRTNATLVSTGMLPIRASVLGGSHVDLASGEVGRVSASASDTDAYTLSTALHLPWWGWVIFLTLCALPLLYTLIIGLPGSLRPNDELVDSNDAVPEDETIITSPPVAAAVKGRRRAPSRNQRTPPA